MGGGGEFREAVQADALALEEIEARRGSELLERAAGPDGGPDDLEEAGALLTSALGRMSPEHPGRLRLTMMLALQQATRYAAFEGTGEHRDAAMSYASACLAWPSADSRTADTCHLIIAWMTLTSRLTAAQRAVLRMRPELEASRRDGAAAAAMLAAVGTVDITPEDAETAVSHLRQISAVDSADEQLRGMVPMLWSQALFVLARAGRISGDIGRVTDDLWLAAGQAAPEDPDRAELLAMRAVLLSIQAEESGLAGERRSSADALRDAAVQLPVSHPARDVLLSGLGLALNRQAAAAGSADDAAAEAEWIVDTLERLPPDAPEYGQILASVATRLLSLQLSSRSAIPVDRIVAQLEVAMERLAPDDPARLLAEFMHAGAIGMRAAMEHKPDVVDTAISELMRCEAGLPAEHPFRPYAAMAIAAALADRYAMTGELRQMDRARTYLGQAFDRLETTGVAPGMSSAHGHMLYLRGLLGLIPVQYASSRHVPAEVLADLERAAELVPADDPLRPRVVADMQVARALQGIMTTQAGRGTSAVGDPERAAFGQVLATAESLSRDHPDFPGLAGEAATGLMLRAIADRDMSLIGQAISLIAEACAVPGLTFRERPRLLNLHGSALLTRYHFTRTPRDLSHATDRLEEARRAVEQETGSPYAADVLESLACAYRYRADAGRQAGAGQDDPRREARVRGDTDRAVTVGLAALREHAGDVLLQDSDENTLSVARGGTSDATEMARWFLDRDRPGPAIAALELGRAMALHAATWGAGVEEVLREAGHADLAARWASEASAGNATGELRYRIMMAIEGSAAEARLLSPPSPEEIAVALAECAADALVYLLPRGDDGAGLAVLVEPGGHVRRVPLPGLYAGAGSPAGTALRARQEADAALADPRCDRARLAAVMAAWREALGELCGWAWQAAVGPVLSAVPVREGRTDRRLVLVPGGELGLVTWHAARRPEGAGYRYACQDAVFSYAPSARQFVEVSRHRPRPWASDPVLISDSAPSLYTTAVGIAHLCTECYPAGSVFGHAHARLNPGAPAAPARPADVLAALPHPDHPGASLLHFGCHGRARVPVLSSHLNLGEGGEVAVRDILRQGRNWQAGRQQAGSGGLVVLASCLSDVAEADFDEALTLATAFISAGAAGVVAARWSVADAETALFMTIFHRYLNGTHPEPAHALRAAQLWMLDPGRTVPDGLPAVLRDPVRGGRLDEPAAWAGFAYQGR
jgi:CHAT domain